MNRIHLQGTPGLKEPIVQMSASEAPEPKHVVVNIRDESMEVIVAEQELQIRSGLSVTHNQT